MSSGVNSKPKFKFSARVEYVTEELDHNGNLYYMFNIKVVADPENSSLEPMQWSVIKSEDDFLQTHKALRNKYGLLKGFQFRNPSAIGSNMFHLTNAVKPRRERKDEYLTSILELDPIPDEIVAFLCLDNASFYNESTNPLSPGVGHNREAPATVDVGTSISRKATPTPTTTPRAATPTATAVSTSSAAAVATPVLLTERERQNKKWWINTGLLLSFVAVAGSAAVLSGLASTLGRATGISRSDSVAMMVYLGVTQYIHFQLVLLRARLEVVIALLVVFTYAHRVIGYALGLYLRRKLDASNSGKFNFHFEWISLRVGLDCNMLVIHGVEWRNPPMFKNTPYLLRIDEISFVVDPVSVYNAIKNNAAIKVLEIRFNKVSLRLEKLSEGSGQESGSVPMLGSGAKKKSLRFEGAHALASTPEDSDLVDGAADTASATGGTETGGATPSTSLKPGVLNLWAAMGATNPQQEASMLTNVSGQMSAAMEGTTNMVNVLSSAVAKYNPTSMLLKGGASLGGAIGSTIGSTIGTGTSLIGNTIGSGVGFLRGATGSGTKKISAAVPEEELAGAIASNTSSAVEGSSPESEEIAKMQQAIEESLQESAESLAEDEAVAEAHAEATAGESSTPPRAGLHKSDSTTNTTAAASGPDKEKKEASKKGFGVPFQFYIQALLLDNLELHTQDFLNASHSEATKASVIKLKSLYMSHRELSKPPKGEFTKRRPLYLDDVVWRLVNKLLAELLRNNSIAMMVLLSSAAVNNTTSVVSSAGSLAYGGASSTKKVLSSVGSSVIGTMYSSSRTAGNTTSAERGPGSATAGSTTTTTTVPSAVPSSPPAAAMATSETKSAH